MIIPDEDFLAQARTQIEQSWDQVTLHTRTGEDNFLTIQQSFPHGLQDLTFVIFNKARRIVGYLMSHNVYKVREELKDIINYSAFALTFIKLDEPGETEEDPLNAR